MAAKAEMTGMANVEQHLKDMEQKWAKASLASDGRHAGADAVRRLCQH